MFNHRLTFLNVVAQATKKVAIIAIAVTISVAAHAQTKGNMAASGNLVIGTGNEYTNICSRKSKIKVLGHTVQVAPPLTLFSLTNQKQTPSPNKK